MGQELGEARDGLTLDIDLHDFDLDRHRATEIEAVSDGKASVFTSQNGPKSMTFDDVKRQRSLPDDLRMIDLHLTPFFGLCLLMELDREALCRYTDQRSGETLIRGKERKSTKPVSRRTISNELSLFRRMLRIAAREGYKVAAPSFEGLIVRTERGGRALTEAEQKDAREVFSKWMARITEFAIETGLSQGDILRLTEDMVDRQRGFIKPEGGRKKTQVPQVWPLTPASSRHTR